MKPILDACCGGKMSRRGLERNLVSGFCGMLSGAKAWRVPCFQVERDGYKAV